MVMSKQQPKWECERCGDCCRTINIPVRTTQDTDPIHGLFAVHGLPINEEFKITLFHTCQHLIGDDPPVCDIYEDRPEICKNYMCRRKNETGIPKRSPKESKG